MSSRFACLEEFGLPFVSRTKSQGIPLTHVKLLRAVWGADYGNELEYLRTYVRMLRKKIEDDPARPQYLMTEPWVGYRFRNPSDPDQAANPLDDE